VARQIAMDLLDQRPDILSAEIIDAIEERGALPMERSTMRRFVCRERGRRGIVGRTGRPRGPSA